MNRKAIEGARNKLKGFMEVYIDPIALYSTDPGVSKKYITIVGKLTT